MRYAWCYGQLAGALLLALVTAQPSPAAPRSCSFRQEVTAGDYLFDVLSRPVIGCSVHVIELKLRHGDTPAVTLKHDSDTYITAAWASDLTGDGVPELMVATRRDGSSAAGSLNAYYLADATLRRAALPGLADEVKVEYQGRDSFRQDGRQIVRTFPAYRQGKPTGASHTLRYELSDGKLVLAAAGDGAPVPAPPASEAPPQPVAIPAPAPAPAPAPTPTLAPVQAQEPPATPPIVAPVTVEQVSLAAAATPAPAARPVIQKVITGAGFLDIETDGPVASYKTMKLDKPTRLVIDIANASTKLSTKPIPIDRFGVKAARVGVNRGVVRIVLDSPAAMFPKHTISTTATGLHIEFSP